MKKSLIAFAALTTSSFSYASFYEHLYLGLGVSNTAYAVHNSEQHFKGNLNTLNLVAGVAFNSYLDVEGRFGFGLINDSYKANDHSVEASLSNVYGIYAKGKLGMFDVITPYALLGYSSSKLKAMSNLTGSTSNKATDLSYGAGVELNLYPVAIHLEYLQYLDSEKYKLSSFNLNLSAKF